MRDWYSGRIRRRRIIPPVERSDLAASLRPEQLDPTYLPKVFYDAVLKTLPVTYVDLIIAKDGKVLVGRRLNEPMKGQFAFIGGRVHYGETTEQAALRIASQEAGLHVTISGLVGVQQLTFSNGESRHCINFVYLVHDNGGEPILDSQHSVLVRLDHIDAELAPYIQRALRDSKVFEPGVAPDFIDSPFFEER